MTSTLPLLSAGASENRGGNCTGRSRLRRGCRGVFCSANSGPTTTERVRQMAQQADTEYFPRGLALCGLNYWDQMNKMNMLSLQRRLERYRIIYSWKVLKNMVPKCGLQEVEALAESCRGRRLAVPDINRKASTSKQLDQVFQVHGPKLFNCLPAQIRKMTKVVLTISKWPWTSG